MMTTELVTDPVIKQYLRGRVRLTLAPRSADKDFEQGGRRAIYCESTISNVHVLRAASSSVDTLPPAAT
jgi:hypothetical protein